MYRLPARAMHNEERHKNQWSRDAPHVGRGRVSTRILAGCDWAVCGVSAGQHDSFI